MGASKSASERPATRAASRAWASKSARTRLVPGRGRGGRRRREVSFFGLFQRCPLEAAAEHVRPSGDVQHQLPDRVRSGHGARRRRLVGHAVEQFVQGRAVPGLAVPKRFDLPGEKGSLRACGARPARGHHLEVLDGGAERVEEALVLRVVSGPLRVLSREPADPLHRVPQRHHAKTGLFAFTPSQQVHAPVAARGRELPDPGLPDVVRVGVGQLRLGEAVPASRDHGGLL